MEHRREHNQGFFESNRHCLNVEYENVPQEAQAQILREAQAGAYWATRAHFTKEEQPALVVMPTGSGKTALMTLIALGIARRRLLIIAPNRFIIEQIAAEFHTFSVARATGSVTEDFVEPQIHVVEHKLRTEEAWQSLREFDVVISTVQCASPQYKDVHSSPPRDLFDTLFFDEAHHWPAKTWNILSQAFPTVRIVGFTATPYRNDKQPIPGNIAYSYPLVKAIERGIYRRVEFVPVRAVGVEEEQDRQLAQSAVEVWKEEIVTWQENSGVGRENQPDPNLNPPPKLLVRVDRIADTERVRNLYTEFGLELQIVSSDNSRQENLAAISSVREDNDCQGLIFVGMLGEGLDLPYLHIAVLHRPYQSFPVTLQFIGRICRMSGEHARSAKLLAIPSQVEQHTRQLYNSDASWSELIPEIADAAVDQERDRRRFARDNWHSTSQISNVSVHTLRPTFAVTVYRIKPENIDLTSEPKLGPSIRLTETYQSEDSYWRVLITQRRNKPSWTTSHAISDITSELSIYYRVDNLLFESTTSPKTATYLRRTFVNGPIRLVSKDRVEQVVSQGTVDAYYTVGMRRTAYLSSRVPSYKTMTGKSAQNAVREGDGQYFTVGHLFGHVKLSDSTMALGVSGGRARIWASARDHLQQFTTWCDSLAARLENDISHPLPYLAHLRSSIDVTQLPTQPYAAELSEDFYLHLSEGLSSYLVDQEGAIHELTQLEDLEIVVDPDSWTEEFPHLVELELLFTEVTVCATMDLEADAMISLDLPEPYGECWIKVQESRRSSQLTLQEYLDRFPPIIYLDDGSTLVGHEWYEYTPRDYSVPDEILEVVPWSELNCDITVEDRDLLKEDHLRYIEERGLITVLEATANMADKWFSEDSVVFIDHHSGEIADLVALTPEGDNVIRVHLLHCKASAKERPGSRQKDAYEVLGQARKCLRRLRSDSLFTDIQERISPDNVVVGDQETLVQLTERSSPQNARYTVHVIQPGFDIGKILSWNDASIRLMMLSLYDQLHSDDVQLRIVGS